MTLLDPDLVLGQIEGQLHLRVFAKGSNHCDTGSGHILDATGQRVLHGPDVDPVTPAVRCAASWQPTGMNTATPVDECFDKTMPVTVTVPGTGTFIALVTGQGEVPLPTGGTQSGILGAGCTEVPIAPGQSQSVTIALHEQLPMGNCGDGILDFDETCDLGTAMNNGTAGCSSTCQTVEQQVNTHPEADHHAPAVIWPTGQRLVIAWEVANPPSTSTLLEHIYGRYYTPAGLPETNPEALAVDIEMAAGPGPKTHVSMAADPMGFVSSWNSLETPAGATAQTYEVDAQAYSFDIPMNARVTYSPGGDRQQDASIAMSATRVVAAWTDGNPSVGILVAGVPRAMPLTAPPRSMVLSMDGGTDVRVAALSSGTFLAAWTATSQVWVRPLDATGTPTGTSMAVTGTNVGAQDQPAIAALPDNTAVVAYRDTSMAVGDTSGAAIRWTVVNAMGQPQGSVHVADTTTDGDQVSPAVVAGGSPATVLFVWQDVTTQHIRGRLRHPDDTSVFGRINGSTTDFQISVGASGSGPRVLPAVAYGGPNGSTYAVTWEDDTSGSQIRMRVFPQ